MAQGTGSNLLGAITAVSTTVAATLLLGFLGIVKDFAVRAPLIEAHMKSTSEELVLIKDKQGEHSLVLATLVKDYTSRDNLRVELDKLDAKIRELQMNQVVIQKQLEGRVRR